MHFPLQIFCCYKALFFLFPNSMSCMCWLHQKNFKQLTVSPLRPHPCLCMCTETHTHVPSHHKPPEPTLSLFVSVGYSSNLPLSPTHGCLSIKARLLLSVLPGMDLFAPGSNTPRQIDSRGYHMILCLFQLFWLSVSE